LEMGRITPPFRQSCIDLLERLRKNYAGMLRDAQNREAFELLLREAWDREHAAMANAEAPLVIDALNLTANVSNRQDRGDRGGSWRGGTRPYLPSRSA